MWSLGQEMRFALEAEEFEGIRGGQSHDRQATKQHSYVIEIVLVE